MTKIRIRIRTKRRRRKEGGRLGDQKKTEALDLKGPHHDLK